MPGIGNVGKLAVDYLSTALQCQTLRSMISPGFPPQVMVIEGCTRLLQIEIKVPALKRDLYIICGDTQPVGVLHMYIVAGQILEAIKSLEATDIVTLAGYVGDAPEKVLGVATDTKTAEELEMNGVALLRGGFIGGLNGIIVGLAPNYGLRGICLLGSTSGRSLIDVKAANNVVGVVGQLLKLDMPLDGLDLSESVEEKESETSRELDPSYR
jgi:hypothetical protein